jgi:hypothetical protein
MKAWRQAVSLMIRRTLTDDELKLLNRLLAEDFPGRDEIAEQIKSAQAEQIDGNGSLKFFVSSTAPVVTRFRIPAEGEFEDADGTTIHVLLHVVNGVIDELEVYKDDSSAVISMPDAKHLRLFYPHGEAQH